MVTNKAVEQIYFEGLSIFELALSSITLLYFYYPEALIVSVILAVLILTGFQKFFINRSLFPSRYKDSEVEKASKILGIKTKSK